MESQCAIQLAKVPDLESCNFSDRFTLNYSDYLIRLNYKIVESLTTLMCLGDRGLCDMRIYWCVHGCPCVLVSLTTLMCVWDRGLCDMSIWWCVQGCPCVLVSLTSLMCVWDRGLCDMSIW